jgi:hypothetical protein
MRLTSLFVIASITLACSAENKIAAALGCRTCLK